jgi:hypothetical protein
MTQPQGLCMIPQVNPDFFRGTVVEKAAAQALAQPSGAPVGR